MYIVLDVLKYKLIFSAARVLVLVSSKEVFLART